MSKKTNINVTSIYDSIRTILENSHKRVIQNVNFEMVTTYWKIGEIIVEEEQHGKERAEYGKYLLKELSIRLTNEFGKGFDETNLRNMRRFYKAFPFRDAVRLESEVHPIGDAVRHQLHSRNESPLAVSPQLRVELSWTHYRLLLKVKNNDARLWYMNEAADNSWSTRVLERQINSFYYERLLKSKDKSLIKKEAEERIKKYSPENILKDPYVLEFLDLADKNVYRESDLEQELIDKLHDFLLELGKGFSFVARQKRIATGDDDFYVDLVFYNYFLKCFVLIDLKIGKLTHQDIGQMDMYVRLYEDKFKVEGDNPTIGIILCSDKNETIVKYSVLNESRQLFASEYQLYLPTEEELASQINNEIQVIREREISYGA
ncbi:MAG: DUF1016 domain-containing protein [Chlorobi bacterium]|nr:DUF1016 domain-containing protein [Chlorobiota bacterium]